MKLRAFILPIFFLMGSASAVSAASLTATFNPTSLFSQNLGVTENPNSVVGLTVTDKLGGGVDIALTNTGLFDRIGSFYFQGFTASQFSAGPGGGVFDASPANQFFINIGGPGVGFSTGSNGPGTSVLFTTLAGSLLTTSDFLATEIGTITVNGGSSNSLELFEGSLSGISPVPLPAALPLMLIGLAGLGIVGRRRQSQA